MLEFLNTALNWRLDLWLFVGLGLGGTWFATRKSSRLSVSPWLLRGMTASMFLLVLAGVVATEVVGSREHDRMKSMVEGFAPTYALGFEGLGYEHLRLDTAADDPRYLRLIEQQREWLRTNPHAHDIYTFHLLPDDTVVLGVDSETDYDRNGIYEGDREQRTALGEPYAASEAQRELVRRCLRGENVFDGSVYVDRWGMWVSAFAPIRDTSGRPIAVLGVDYAAEVWVDAILSLRLTALSVFTLLLMLVGGGITLFESHRRRVTGLLLAEHNQRLELANQGLREATEAAHAANKAKTQFLANMSHELRTPLTAMLGFADLLLECEPGGEEGRQCVETIRRSGKQLLTIVSDVLDLAKTEAGVVDLTMAPCAPRSLCAEVQTLLLHQARQKGLDMHVEVDVDVPALITTDGGRLRQILINLVGNAVKFTDRGSVRLQLKYGATRDLLQFRVIDSGDGMALPQQQRLFQPFSQIDASASRRHGGTGLGLVISRRFAVLLGGDLTLESTVGQGSTFTLTLPCKEVLDAQMGLSQLLSTASENSAASPVAMVGAGKQPLRGCVLLAEDGPDNQRLISHLLRRAGLQVEVVGNGKLAVDRLLAAMPTAAIDLVLMDMQMPEMDGYEATRRLREAGCRLPIVAVTAHATTQDRDLCLTAGCDDYLTKPIDRSKLIDSLRHWIPQEGL